MVAERDIHVAMQHGGRGGCRLRSRLFETEWKTRVGFMQAWVNRLKCVVLLGREDLAETRIVILTVL